MSDMSGVAERGTVKAGGSCPKDNTGGWGTRPR
jgi:hypothetical protein